jgi:hypothetical protein
MLDYTKPHYSGSGTYIGDDLFAHGGSGFFVSQAAMRTVFEYYTVHQREIEGTTESTGLEIVFLAVFEDAGLPHTNSWPIFQGDYPGVVPYANPNGRSSAEDEMRLWCYPSVSYHHVTTEVIEDLWRFKQQWFASDQKGKQPTAADDLSQY